MFFSSLIQNHFSFSLYFLLSKMFLLFFLAFIPALAAQETQGTDISVRLTPLYCPGLSLRVRGGSHAAAWSDNLRRAPLLTLPEISSGYADRVFLNGYVQRDPGTGNPATVMPDSTWFWGYADASQYNLQKQTLSFQKISWAQEQEFSFNGWQYSEHSSSQTEAAIGLELAGEYLLYRRERCQLGLRLAWMVIPDMDFQQQLRNFACSHHSSSKLLEVLETYYYDVSGINMPPPGHAGTYLGPFDSPPTIPSPVIPNQPQDIEQTLTGHSLPADSSTAYYHNQVRYALHCISHELQLGLNLSRAMYAERLIMTFAPAAALQLLSLDARRGETLYVDGHSAAAWQNHKHLTRLLPGLILAAHLEYHFHPHWYLAGSAAFHWYPQEVAMTLGPGKITLQSSKIILGVSLGYCF
ncbi:MAG: hypothetical protein GX902_13225 [Lentisphaerae bacterium]|nr:hypothetical protein [Lentisphaerota bacterium]